MILSSSTEGDELGSGKLSSKVTLRDSSILIVSLLSTMLLSNTVGIKSLFNAVSITAALIDVNAAQSKLVLLENFNENYSKCLRLLVKLQLPVRCG
ncbi:hypothetical protein Tco_0750182 [Tanacetum coccineum]|uniref:Uncharacterized protein n=1 Tax=Tanacetum coccineum TaxID=301880 RepID=A0ABQ4Z358_9ASTR